MLACFLTWPSTGERRDALEMEWLLKGEKDKWGKFLSVFRWIYKHL